jgi:hypothetical protein
MQSMHVIQLLLKLKSELHLLFMSLDFLGEFFFELLAEEFFLLLLFLELIFSLSKLI